MEGPLPQLDQAAGQTAHDGPAEGAQLDGPVLVEGGGAVCCDGRGDDHLLPGGKGAAGEEEGRGDE